MTVLLVGCYELGRQPLGVARPLAHFERAGFDAAVIDLQVEGLDEERIEGARLAVLSVPMHTALKLGLRAAAAIRRANPDCRIVFHGLYALLNAEMLLDGPADWVLGGECEDDLVELARSLARGEAPAPAARAGIERGTYLAPQRDGLPGPERYARLLRGGATILAGQVEATRGCKHLCTHCPIPPVYDGRFFAVPVDTVIEDAGRQIDSGVRHLSFADADFLNGPGHALAIARELHRRWPDLTWDMTAKVEHLLAHRELLEELRDCGLLFVVSAVESRNDEVLRHLAKGHDAEDVAALVRWFREIGLTLRPTFVPFTPWETLDSFRELLDFGAREGLVDHVDPVQWSIRLLVPPGSLLEDSPAFLPYRRTLVREELTWSWRHPDPRMDQLQGEIAELVEAHAAPGEEPRGTFLQIRALARDAAAGWPARRGRGTASLLGPPLPPPPDPAPPRLTEAWFC